MSSPIERAMPAAAPKHGCRRGRGRPEYGRASLFAASRLIGRRLGFRGDATGPARLGAGWVAGEGGGTADRMGGDGSLRGNGGESGVSGDRNSRGTKKKALTLFSVLHYLRNERMPSGTEHLREFPMREISTLEPTRYEIAARHPDGRHYLIGYTVRRSRSGLLAAMRRVGPQTVAKLAIGESDLISWHTKPVIHADVAGWWIGFTGRTQRDARFSELQFVAA